MAYRLLPHSFPSTGPSTPRYRCGYDCCRTDHRYFRTDAFHGRLDAGAHAPGRDHRPAFTAKIRPTCNFRVCPGTGDGGNLCRTGYRRAQDSRVLGPGMAGAAPFSDVKQVYISSGLCRRYRCGHCHNVRHAAFYVQSFA